MSTHPLDEIERTAQAEIRLAHFQAEQIRHATTYFGYPEVPENNDLAMLGISGLAKLHLNNAGDPWVHGNAQMHTKPFEREVLARFAELYGIADDHWGYVTSGGTEGNLYGAYMAREVLEQRGLRPVLLCSRATHYSVRKNARLLGVPLREVATDDHDELDYAALREVIDELEAAAPGQPGFIVNLNVGTTMRGAVDDVRKVVATFEAAGIPAARRMIHADAALLGLIYPFTRGAADLFACGVASVAVSGHKFIGAIHPCGVVLARRSVQAEAFGESWVPYVGSRDTTISGSRNGFLALNLWYLLERKSIEGIKREAEACIENARYLARMLRMISYPDVGWLPDQIIVTLRTPPEEIVRTYQLATQGPLAHVVCMQHITKHRIEGFVEDLARAVGQPAP